jgi:hypothetical protein
MSNDQVESLQPSPLLGNKHSIIRELSCDDRLAIQNLNSRHFHALDALDRILPGDPAETWADTFHSDGIFEIQSAEGNVIFKAQGRDELIKAHRSFPDIAITRHWISNLLIEAHPQGARSGSYIIAMNISVNPATIIRTGTYDDIVVLKGDLWLYQQKTLILDAFSPSAE